MKTKRLKPMKEYQVTVEVIEREQYEGIYKANNKKEALKKFYEQYDYIDGEIQYESVEVVNE